MATFSPSLLAAHRLPNVPSFLSLDSMISCTLRFTNDVQIAERLARYGDANIGYPRMGRVLDADGAGKAGVRLTD